MCFCFLHKAGFCSRWDAGQLYFSVMVKYIYFDNLLGKRPDLMWNKKTSIVFWVSSSMMVAQSQWFQNNNIVLQSLPWKQITFLKQKPQFFHVFPWSLNSCWIFTTGDAADLLAWKSKFYVYTESKLFEFSNFMSPHTGGDICCQ